MRLDYISLYHVEIMLLTHKSTKSLYFFMYVKDSLPFQSMTHITCNGPGISLTYYDNDTNFSSLLKNYLYLLSNLFWQHSDPIIGQNILKGVVKNLLLSINIVMMSGHFSPTRHSYLSSLKMPDFISIL